MFGSAMDLCRRACQHIKGKTDAYKTVVFRYLTDQGQKQEKASESKVTKLTITNFSEDDKEAAEQILPPRNVAALAEVFHNEMNTHEKSLRPLTHPNMWRAEENKKFVNLVKEHDDAMKTVEDLSRTINELESSMDQLKEELDKQRTIQEENDRLRHLLDRQHGVLQKQGNLAVENRKLREQNETLKKCVRNRDSIMQENRDLKYLLRRVYLQASSPDETMLQENRSLKKVVRDMRAALKRREKKLKEYKEVMLLARDHLEVFSARADVAAVYKKLHSSLEGLQELPEETEAKGLVNIIRKTPWMQRPGERNYGTYGQRGKSRTLRETFCTSEQDEVRVAENESWCSICDVDHDDLSSLGLQSKHSSRDRRGEFWA